MNYQIVKEFPHPMMEKGKRPVISIYVDTHIKKPDRLENPIRFKNLVKEAQASLKDKEFKGFKDLFSLFKEMEEDALFWEGATESMAILGDEDECIVYKLPVNVKSLAIVSDSFYIKPLLRSFQSNGHYHVLGLNRDNFVLFEADRYGITEIPVDASDATMEGVLGTEKTAPHLSVASIGGDQSMYHGHGGAKDERKVDQEKFFRHVDTFVLEQYSKKQKIPLILVSPDEHQGEFRKLSKNNFLIDEGIKIDGDALDKKSLYVKVQDVMQERFKKELKDRMAAFSEAHAKDLGSDDVIQIGRAIVEGKVASLYLEENTVHPGRFDPQLGTVMQGEIADPRVGDVYDDMAEVVLSRGGEVLILSKDEMPTERDLAAVYRY
ncbi:Bacterial archaeo-eukaryotic release factor family 8 [anaerobic digester metagenome]